jgi:ADP-heptose:LPS heptosyltransferase
MRVLVFRLSSLGDLILSTAFLENLPRGLQVDWVVSADFAFVLRHHPGIRRLWVFDRKEGFRGWMRLIAQLHAEGYEVRVDLHRTIRTRIAFLFFFIRDLFKGMRAKNVRVSKERLRTLFLFCMKGFLPSRLKPTPYWLRFAGVGRGVAASFLSAGDGVPGDPLKMPSYLACLRSLPFDEADVLASYGVVAGSYFALMPSSRWPAKEWGTEKFLNLILEFQGRGLIPLLLGREQDASGRRLRALLEEHGVEFRDAFSEPDFLKTAVLLKNARFYVGCDTGMSHLAEGVGCPAVMIFGPTRPELGFGPCRPRSRAVSLPISCAPCSKDGRFCFRLTARNQCMRGLGEGPVIESIAEVLP